MLLPTILIGNQLQVNICDIVYELGGYAKIALEGFAQNGYTCKDNMLLLRVKHPSSQNAPRTPELKLVTPPPAALNCSGIFDWGEGSLGYQ